MLHTDTSKYSPAFISQLIQNVEMGNELFIIAFRDKQRPAKTNPGACLLYDLILDDPEIIPYLENAGLVIYDPAKTSQLKKLMDQPSNFSAEKAMKLVREGANPHSINSERTPLLHLVCYIDHTNQLLIEELVNKHGVNIESTDGNSLTALQKLLSDPHVNTADPMHLIRTCGANSNSKNTSGLTLIHILIQAQPINHQNFIPLIDELIKKYDANIEAQDNQNRTSLQQAIDSHTYHVNMLLIQGLILTCQANPSPTRETGEKLLHSAWSHGSQAVDLLRTLLEKYHIDVNCVDAYGFTILQKTLDRPYASSRFLNPSYHSQVAELELLLKFGAHPQTKNKKGKTAAEIYQNLKRYDIETTDKLRVMIRNLSHITKLTDENILRLLRSGANPNIRNANGTALIGLLCYPEHQNHALIEELVHQHGADIEIETEPNYHMTPLQYLVQQGKYPGIDKDIMHLVKKCGANANTKSLRGQPILHFLANIDSPHTVELALTNGVNIHSTDELDRTILQAIMEKHLFNAKMAMTLITEGKADPHTTTRTGVPLFHLISMNPDNIEYMRQLVNDYGVDVNCVDRDNLTALQKLLDKPEGFRMAQIQCLFDLGANPQDVNKSGVTAAALFEKAKKYDEEKTIALRNLINSGYCFEIAKATALVLEGADPNTRNNNGTPLLHLLCYRRHENLVAIETLVKCGADIESRDGRNQTPVQKLLNDPNTTIADVMHLIRKCGADANVSNSQNRPLIHCIPYHRGNQSGNKSDISVQLELIDEHRVGINTPDIFGKTFLQNVLNHPNGYAISDVQELVKRGADQLTITPSGETVEALLRKEAQKQDSLPTEFSFTDSVQRAGFSLLTTLAPDRLRNQALAAAAERDQRNEASYGL